MSQSGPAETAPASPLQALIDGSPLRPVQLQVVLLCALVTLVEGIDLNLIPLLAPAIARDWALPSGAFGAIFSSGPVGLIMGGLGIGWLADRIGRRNALIVAMIIMTIATLATAFARNVPDLLVCRVITGIGFGGVVPAASTLVSEFLPTKTRASVVAFVILGQAAGGLLASIIMQTPLGLLGWQSLIFWMSLLCLGTTVFIFAALPESPRYLLLRHGGTRRLSMILARLRLSETPAPEAGPDGTPRGSIRALFEDGRAPGTLLLWCLFLGICSAVSFFTSWLPLIFTYAGATPAEAARVASAYWAGGIISGLLLPLLALRWNVNLVLLGTVLVAALCAAGLGLTIDDGLVANLLVALICGAFVNGAFYLMYPPVVRFYPTAIRSTGIGAAVAFGRIGNVLSPLVASLLLDAELSPATVFVAMAAPLALSFAALALLHFSHAGANRRA